MQPPGTKVKVSEFAPELEELSENPGASSQLELGEDPSCGADTPQECAQRWRRMVPEMPEMVARWIEDGGVTVQPPDLTPVDEPGRPVGGLSTGVAGGQQEDGR